ncbi:HAD family hydrolase [Beduini massiliensis]|uniref:HAD family hydrolase n=1 Tax=Beduini massiliensis TaxID=1585974 RepID=UPI00059A9C92|nr:HAD family phosphatase [Beduini massiliensis]
MEKAVIFDFNGTLFFDNDKHIQAWNEMSLTIRQKGISEEELHTRLNGVPNHQIIEYFLQREIDEKESKRYSLMKEELYRQACLDDPASFHLVKGVTEYFDLLKKQAIPFTIASASIKENIDFFVEHFHLDRWMDPEKIVYDNGSYTSKEKMFLDAAKLLDCDIQEILIFEDSLAGIHHAYEAGCRKIIVVCPKEKEETFKALPGVIQTIQDFSEMMK